MVIWRIVPLCRVGRQQTNEPIDDKDIQGRYEKDILALADVRLIGGYCVFLGFLNLIPSRTRAFARLRFKEESLQPRSWTPAWLWDIWTWGSKVQTSARRQMRCLGRWRRQWFAKFKKGTTVFVQKAFTFSRTVTGQVPTGWNAFPMILSLVCTAEVLNASGITELHKHMHPSDVGRCLGSGMGGVTSMAKMFKDCRDEKDVQNDILQET